ncbi:MAG: F420-dependent methylenetetrahydromethanopterin dehydrogenase [Euryarchaeota archaeon]|nr:F420-dependent methylenetetrahydromethanopterin dehydrogenase [Euryarchaeota archaeon]
MKIGVVKTGNIGCSLVLELLLDERADREDIDVRVVTSGAKMGKAQAEEVAGLVLDLDAELILYSTPNPSAPGPRKVMEALKGRRAVVFGDAPGLKARDYMEEAGLGYILVKGDPMIGARREFLDPVEMTLFNADVLKVLAGTGVINLIQAELGRTMAEEGYLPRVVVTRDVAVAHAGYSNPYARAKAMAAYEMAEKVGQLDVEGCFMTKDAGEYIPKVAAAHELLRAAARLADEAREMEKAGDAVKRTPHAPDGRIMDKRGLMDKPQ